MKPRPQARPAVVQELRVIVTRMLAMRAGRLVDMEQSLRRDCPCGPGKTFEVSACGEAAAVVTKATRLRRRGRAVTRGLCQGMPGDGARMCLISPSMLRMTPATAMVPWVLVMFLARGRRGRHARRDGQPPTSRLLHGGPVAGLGWAGSQKSRSAPSPYVLDALALCHSRHVDTDVARLRASGFDVRDLDVPACPFERHDLSRLGRSRSGGLLSVGSSVASRSGDLPVGYA